MTPWASRWDVIEVSVGVKRFSLGVMLLFWTLVSVQWAGYSVPLVRPVIGFVLLTLLPGALFLIWLGITPRMSARWLVYVVGCSLIVLMSLGLAIHVVLSALGYSPAFSLETFALGITATLLSFLYMLRRNDSDTLDIAVRVDNSTLVFLQIPLWAILAINYLNNTGTNIPLVVVLGVLSLVPVSTAIGLFSEEKLALGVWTSAIAVLYHKSLWGMHVYHGHASAIAIWATGIWDSASENLLSLAILPPMYSYVLDVPILTQLKVAHPILVAFIPLGMYAMFRAYVGPIQGFLGASLFVFAHPFYFQYPSEPRVGLPVLFLVLLGVALSDDRLSQVQTRMLSLMFGVGIVVSHYGTSYYVMFAIVGAGVLQYMYPVLDMIVAYYRNPQSDEPLTGPIRERFRGTRIQGLNWSFGGFYLVSTLAWYLYTKQSRTFESLVEHVINAMVSLLSDSSGLGSTATRLQTDYGGVSIPLSKYLYMLFGLLLGLGLAVCYYRRFLSSAEARFDDEFLALSSLLFVLFGGSLVFSGEWGGGRPMMIVFCFGSIFIVIGTEKVSQLVQSSFVSVTSFVRGDFPSVLPPRSNVPFGTVLTIFLLLNTGVVAASTPGGRAPSNVPLQDGFSESDNPNLQTLLFIPSDTDLHAWLAVHRNTSYEIYGDRLVRAQATDWYVGRIIASTGTLESYRFKKSNHLHHLDGGGVEPGYLLLIGHNIVYGTIAIDYISWEDIGGYDLELGDRSRVYSNGKGMIYIREQEGTANESI